MTKLILYRGIPSVNEVNRWRYKRQHWRLKQEKNAWRVLLLSAGKDVRETQTPRQVIITSVRKRLLDKDNLYGSVKLLVDSMVKLKWLVDDRPAYLDLEVRQKKIEKGEKENTQIEISD